jgi:hypothetical protein
VAGKDGLVLDPTEKQLSTYTPIPPYHEVVDLFLLLNILEKF